MESEDGSMLSHYVQNYMAGARAVLNAGKVEESDRRREELIGKLQTLEENDLAKKAVNYLEGTKWNSPDKILAFQNWYDARGSKVNEDN